MRFQPTNYCLLLSFTSSLLVVVASISVEVPGYGTVIGVADQFGPSVEAFLGIPYAEPPVGNLRFRPPIIYKNKNDVINATAFGNRCIPANDDYDENSAVNPFSPESEDCLFLNIYRPAAQTMEKSSNGLLPVLFVIHGGGFDDFSSNEIAGLTSSLAQFASPNILIVTINYRLGLFGFLGGDLMRQYNDGRFGSSGNFGIMDQQMAMLWVHDNIEAFGGDPLEVTILGFSAGGVSVRTHLVLETSWPYFNKAVIQAGTYTDAATMDAANEKMDNVLQMSNCTSVQCLANLNTAELRLINVLLNSERVLQPFSSTNRKPSNSLWQPIVDREFLLDMPSKLIDTGFVKNVPLIIGANRDEFGSFWLNPTSISEQEYDNLLANGGFNATEIQFIKELYSPANYEYPDSLDPYNNWWFTAMRGETDQVLGFGFCGVRFNARLYAKAGLKVYAYTLDHPLQTAVFDGSGPGSPLSSHIYELLYTFAAFPALSDATDLQLAFYMSGYWLSFIRTGVPSFPGLPIWPKYNIQNDLSLVFDTPSPLGKGIRSQTDLRKDACDFWESEYYRFSSS